LKKKFSFIANYPAPLRLGIFIFILLLLWLPIALIIYFFLQENTNLVTIVTMSCLFLDFLILVNLWGKKVYGGVNLFKVYGLEWNRKNAIYLFRGLAIGLCFCLGLFALEFIFGWIELQKSSSDLWRIIAEGLLSALGIGFAEELVFRGWILSELEKDYSPQASLWINGVLFAIAHFLKPLTEIIRTLVTFPALIILGLILVWAKRGHQNYLGISIGIHAGLVWGYYILNVGQLFKYTDRANAIVTGIDGNPSAGLMGVLFLSILAIWARSRVKF
jgi:hypothetical protein